MTTLIRGVSTLLLLLTIIIVCSLPLRGQTGHAPTPHLPNTPDYYLGFSNWECGQRYPYAFVRVSFRGMELAGFSADSQFVVTPVFIETVAHELRHVEQMLEVGSCLEWVEKSRSDPFREQMELDAEETGSAFRSAQRISRALKGATPQ